MERINDMPTVGQLVRERREALKLTMDAVAHQAHVSRSTVHRVEHDHEQRTQPSKLARVLTVVGVTPEQLRPRVDDPEYTRDVARWMGRPARPRVRRSRGTASADTPDLVALHPDDTYALVRVPSGRRLDELSAALETAGWLVTTPINALGA
jgi:DNA-binding XRE family transcriptional regulator